MTKPVSKVKEYFREWGIFFGKDLPRDFKKRFCEIEGKNCQVQYKIRIVNT
jgi:hypothetical protein